MQLLLVLPECIKACCGPVLMIGTGGFRIIHDWCDVLLCRRGRRPVSIGTHFDAPTAFVMAEGCDWCASAGCGVVVYYLRPPFAPFACDHRSPQWWEIGRDLDRPWDVVLLRVIAPHTLRIVVCTEAGLTRAYSADVRTRRLRRHRLAGLPRLYA